MDVACRDHLGHGHFRLVLGEGLVTKHPSPAVRHCRGVRSPTGPPLPCPGGRGGPHARDLELMGTNRNRATPQSPDTCARKSEPTAHRRVARCTHAFGPNQPVASVIPKEPQHAVFVSVGWPGAELGTRIRRPGFAAFSAPRRPPWRCPPKRRARPPLSEHRPLARHLPDRSRGHSPPWPEPQVCANHR